jgi:hypothetical protein
LTKFVKKFVIFLQKNHQKNWQKIAIFTPKNGPKNDPFWGVKNGTFGGGQGGGLGGHFGGVLDPKNWRTRVFLKFCQKRDPPENPPELVGFFWEGGGQNRNRHSGDIIYKLGVSGGGRAGGSHPPKLAPPKLTPPPPHKYVNFLSAIWG